MSSWCAVRVLAIAMAPVMVHPVVTIVTVVVPLATANTTAIVSASGPSLKAGSFLVIISHTVIPKLKTSHLEE